MTAIVSQKQMIIAPFRYRLNQPKIKQRIIHDAPRKSAHMKIVGNES